MKATADDIKRSLLHKILTGRYPVGSRLPSCRDLAAELGINRNTASKVYAKLAQEGYVKTERGQGVVVTAQPPANTAPPASVHDLLAAATREAKLLGMSREGLMHMVSDVVNTLYSPVRPRIAFIECNEQDLASLARAIQDEVGLPVEPVLLSALEQSPAAVAAAHDIVVTTLYHLAAVTQSMEPAGATVVAVHAPPDPNTLRDIARLDPTTRVGVICERETTQQYLIAAIGMVYRGPISGHLLADQASMARIHEETDALVDVPSCHEAVARLYPAKPIITVRFALDSKSLSDLKARISALTSSIAS